MHLCENHQDDLRGPADAHHSMPGDQNTGAEQEEYDSIFGNGAFMFVGAYTVALVLKYHQTKSNAELVLILIAVATIDTTSRYLRLRLIGVTPR